MHKPVEMGGQTGQRAGIELEPDQAGEQCAGHYYITMAKQEDANPQR